MARQRMLLYWECHVAKWPWYYGTHRIKYIRLWTTLSRNQSSVDKPKLLSIFLEKKVTPHSISLLIKPLTCGKTDIPPTRVEWNHFLIPSFKELGVQIRFILSIWLSMPHLHFHCETGQWPNFVILCSRCYQDTKAIRPFMYVTILHYPTLPYGLTNSRCVYSLRKITYFNYLKCIHHI